MEEKKFPYFIHPTSPPKTDLTGRRFGYIVVLSWQGYKVYASGRTPMWEVKCDCGKIVTRSIRVEHYQKKLSCGCRLTHQRSKSMRQSLIGMKVGTKKVIKHYVYIYKPNKSFVYYILKCKCGNLSKYSIADVKKLSVGNCAKCSKGRKIHKTDWEDISELIKIYTEKQVAEMYQCTPLNIRKVLKKIRRTKNGKS